MDNTQVQGILGYKKALHLFILQCSTHHKNEENWLVIANFRVFTVNSKQIYR